MLKQIIVALIRWDSLWSPFLSSSMTPIHSWYSDLGRLRQTSDVHSKSQIRTLNSTIKLNFKLLMPIWPQQWENMCQLGIQVTETVNNKAKLTDKCSYNQNTEKKDIREHWPCKNCVLAGHPLLLFHMLPLKGVSHELFRVLFWHVWIDLGLYKNLWLFLIFSVEPLILYLHLKFRRS
jgi:hypothetical protein